MAATGSPGSAGWFERLGRTTPTRPLRSNCPEFLVSCQYCLSPVILRPSHLLLHRNVYLEPRQSATQGRQGLPQSIRRQPSGGYGVEHVHWQAPSVVAGAEQRFPLVLALVVP